MVFETIENKDSKLKEGAKNLIAFDLKDNFYSTWDFRNYSRFYFLKDQKGEIKEDQRFVYDNKYVAEIDFSIEHFKEYNEKEIAKIIKQNFPKIQKNELSKRLNIAKAFYFSSEPASFYRRSEAFDIFGEQVSSAKELVFTVGNCSKAMIDLFF